MPSSQPSESHLLCSSCSCRQPLQELGSLSTSSLTECISRQMRKEEPASLMGMVVVRCFATHASLISSSLSRASTIFFFHSSLLEGRFFGSSGSRVWSSGVPAGRPPPSVSNHPSRVFKSPRGPPYSSLVIVLWLWWGTLFFHFVPTSIRYLTAPFQ